MFALKRLPAWVPPGVVLADFLCCGAAVLKGERQPPKSGLTRERSLVVAVSLWPSGSGRKLSGCSQPAAAVHLGIQPHWELLGVSAGQFDPCALPFRLASCIPVQPESAPCFTRDVWWLSQSDDDSDPAYPQKVNHPSSLNGCTDSVELVAFRSAGDRTKPRSTSSPDAAFDEFPGQPPLKSTWFPLLSREFHTARVAVAMGDVAWLL